ncbi:hypothetical protein MC885_021476 [Smutsia gigantea]|nr:hypothetical protein MC885_021476 [Smutsia gigantea]
MLTGAAGNTSSAADTSPTPSPRTVATIMCTCTLSATVTDSRLLGSGSPGSLGGVGARLMSLCGRLKDCSEKTNSGSSRDVGSTCFSIIQSPCFGLIPEEECVGRFWYSWCKSYRPISVAVIHHPLHHDYGADDLNEEEEEEEEAASLPLQPRRGLPPHPPTHARALSRFPLTQQPPSHLVL